MSLSISSSAVGAIEVVFFLPVPSDSDRLADGRTDRQSDGRTDEQTAAHIARLGTLTKLEQSTQEPIIIAVLEEKGLTRQPGRILPD